MRATSEHPWSSREGMTHPIFDLGAYPWKLTEARELYEVLTVVIGRTEEIVAIFEQAGGHRPALNERQAVNLVWKDALDLLAEGPGIRELCAMLERNPRLAGNTTLHARLRAVAEAVPVVHARVHRDGVVVLDRDELRAKIALLEPDVSPLSVLLVQGPPKSGKSHSHYLFRRVAESRGAAVVCVGEGVVGDARDLVEWLFDELDAPDEIPAGDTSDRAWYQKVCRALARIAKRTRQSMWIVVDDLGERPDGTPILDSTILDFCNEFATLLHNPQLARWFRLMLIHYPDGPAPTKWRDAVWERDLAHADGVDETHVEGYLGEWQTAAGGRLRGDQIRGITREVMAACATAGDETPRLQVLREELARRLDAVG